MTSMAKRIMTGCIAVPVLIGIVIFLPHLNYLAFCILIMGLTMLGSVEMHQLLSKDGEKLPFTSYTGALLPLAQYTQFSFFSDTELTFYTLMFLIGLTLFIEIFTGSEDRFHGTWERNSKTVLNIIYPGLFASFIIRLAFFQNAAWFILFFFLLVFSSDTFAFFFGIAFGKNNKGVIKVSPNKSIAGFIGGLLVPGVLGMLSAKLFPEVFSYTVAEGFLVGFVTACLGTVGDLIESSFKRSAEVKDSGSIIPGRGGILDSIDSIIMAAPVYVAMIMIVFSI